MKTRRILYVATGKVFGGAERVTLSLASAFASSGAEVRCVIHPGVERFSKELGRAGVSVAPIPEAFSPFRMNPFIREVRAFRPDLVHIQRTWPLSDVWAAPAAYMAGVRVITTEHVRWEGCGLRDRMIKRWIVSFDRKIVAVSHAVRESLIRYWKTSPSRVIVVENGIDTDRFARPEGGEALPGLFPARCPACIGAIGRLESQKGFDVLIDAMSPIRKRMPGAVLVIAGEGSLREELQKRVRRNGLEDAVLFVGVLSDIAPFLGSLDLFVLPSRWEGLPLTVLEAMAAGTPIVTTAVEGTAEAVRHEKEGLIAPIDDSESLAEACLSTLSDGEGTRSRVTAARNRVREKYSIERMVDEYRQVYET